MNRPSVLIGSLIMLFSSLAGQTSRNEEFSVLVKVGGRAKSSNEHTTWTASILDRSGSTRYQIAKEIPYDIQFPAISLAYDGSAFVVHAFSGFVEFYDNTGNIVRTLEPLGRKTVEHEQIIKCSVAGNRVALLFSTPDVEHAFLLMTNLRGEELWRRELNGKYAAEVFLSSNEHYIAAGSYTMVSVPQNALQIFDENGNQIASLGETFRYADITDDGKLAFTGRNSVTLYQIGKPQSTFEWRTTSKEDIVTGVKCVGGFVACSVEHVTVESGMPTYRNPKLILLDARGRLHSTKQMTGSSLNPAILSIEQERIVLSSAQAHVSVLITEMK